MEPGHGRTEMRSAQDREGSSTRRSTHRTPGPILVAGRRSSINCSCSKEYRHEPSWSPELY